MGRGGEGEAVQVSTLYKLCEMAPEAILQPQVQLVSICSNILLCENLMDVSLKTEAAFLYASTVSLNPRHKACIFNKC